MRGRGSAKDALREAEQQRRWAVRGVLKANPHVAAVFAEHERLGGLVRTARERITAISKAYGVPSAFSRWNDISACGEWEINWGADFDRWSAAIRGIRDRPRRAIARPGGMTAAAVRAALPTRPGSSSDHRVPVEHIGKARLLRNRIAADAPRFEAAADAIIKPLRPRPAWPSPTKPSYLRDVARRYRAPRSVCRLDAIIEVDGDGRLVLNELRLAPGRMRFAGWSADEPSIRIVMRWLTTPPFAEGAADIVEIGLHAALARRFERARPNDAAAVLRDVRALARGYLDAQDPSGEFEIETPCGRQVGAVIIPAGEGEAPRDALRAHLHRRLAPAFFLSDKAGSGKSAHAFSFRPYTMGNALKLCHAQCAALTRFRSGEC